MDLKRKSKPLKHTKEVLDLIEEIWDSQDSLIISLEDQSATYVSICDDLNDLYHGQGALIRAKDYSSFYCFVPAIRDIIKEFTNNLSGEDTKLQSVYNNLIVELNKLDHNLL